MKKDTKFPMVIWEAVVHIDGEDTLSATTEGRVVMRGETWDNVRRERLHDLEFEITDGKDGLGTVRWKKAGWIFPEFLSYAGKLIVESKEGD